MHVHIQEPLAAAFGIKFELCCVSFVFFCISSADTRPGLVSAAVARTHNIEKKNKVSNSKNVFKPKAVVEHEKREEGLQSAISSDNKGFAMLTKMGYKPGMGIGKKGEKK